MSAGMRVMFMGTPDFAATIAESLIHTQGFETVCIVSQPDRPVGRGREIQTTPTKRIGLKHGISVFQPTHLKTEETYRHLASFKPDLVLVAAYGRILPPRLLTLPRRGCFNLHASLLPRHRGASPVTHALLVGDTETGISLMQMDEGLDTGPVYARRKLTILESDTTESLTARLAALAGESVREDLPNALSSGVQPEPQDADGASYAPILKKSDGFLDFRREAHELERAVRAYRPWPIGFFISAQGERIQVLDSTLDDGRGSPGEILAITGRGVEVACGGASLWLCEVKAPNRRAMAASEWARGRRLKPHDVLLPTTSPGA